MEIHAPHHPVLSLREALVHLAIVTVGILIALSFEGTRQWFEHRVQVEEARRNLLSEIRRNKDALEKDFLARVAATRRDTAGAAAAAQALMRRDASVDLHWQSDYPLTQLQSSGFATAQATGALALMDYVEVSRFAAVYRLQETFERQHEAGLESGNMAFAIGKMISSSLAKQGPKPTISELEEWRRLIATLDASILVQSQIGARLDVSYKVLLGETPTSETPVPH